MRCRLSRMQRSGAHTQPPLSQQQQQRRKVDIWNAPGAVFPRVPILTIHSGGISFLQWLWSLAAPASRCSETAFCRDLESRKSYGFWNVILVFELQPSTPRLTTNVIVPCRKLSRNMRHKKINLKEFYLLANLFIIVVWKSNNAKRHLVLFFECQTYM
jgi:hypothetical protein